MAEPVKDPVCGMTVDPDRTPHHHTHDGATHHFCGGRCAERFRVAPESFLTHRRDVAPPAGAVEYTCPMHPEVVQIGPGVCPICGMALEPRTISADVEETSPELSDMTRRLWIGAAFAVPLFLLAMSDLIPGQPVQHAIGHRTLSWIQLALATPVVLWCGWPFFQRGWASVRS